MQNKGFFRRRACPGQPFCLGRVQGPGPAAGLSPLLLALLFLLLFSALPLAAAERHFPQGISWKADRYALEYKVEIQTAAGEAVQTLTTEKSSLELSLPAGSYRYRVTAIDILEREAAVSDWVSFEILQAAAPEIEKPQPQASLAEDGSSLELEVAVGSVSGASTVELVNASSGKVIRGTLVVTGGAGASSLSETAHATRARFKNVSEGSWRLRVTNPSGLASESEAFVVKDVIKEERLAAEKAEKERLAAEKAEAERLAAEKRAAEEAEEARLAAEKAEAERLAAEKWAAEEAEKARLAAEKRAAEEAEKARLAAEKAEAERLAAEKRAAEEAEAERQAAEKERLAAEKALSKKEQREAAFARGKDLHFLIGGGLAQAVGSSALSDYGYSSLSPALTARLSWLPVKAGSFRFGGELAVSGSRFKSSEEFYDTALSFASLKADLLLQHSLFSKRLYVTAKGGGALWTVEKEVAYSGSFEGRSAPQTEFFGYGAALAGFSLFWLPQNHLAVELGVDGSHLFAPDMPLVMLEPYLCIGLRL